MQPNHITIRAHTELTAERNRARVIAVALEQELAEIRAAAIDLVDYLLSAEYVARPIYGGPSVEETPAFIRLAEAVASS